MRSKKSGETPPRRDVIKIRSIQHMANPFKDVITRLEKQKSSIEKALEALREVDNVTEELQSNATKSKLAHRAKGKRKISVEGRRRMAEAQQKRRAAAKRASEVTVTKKATRKSAVKKSTPKKAAATAE